MLSKQPVASSQATKNLGKKIKDLRVLDFKGFIQERILDKQREAKQAMLDALKEAHKDDDA